MILIQFPNNGPEILVTVFIQFLGGRLPEAEGNGLVPSKPRLGNPFAKLLLGQVLIVLVQGEVHDPWEGCPEVKISVRVVPLDAVDEKVFHSISLKLRHFS